MGWGALMGLGQGLQQLGGSMQENAKAKMLQQLELDKEERAEQRQVERENRAAARQEAQRAKQVESTKFVQRDGAWFEQKLNADRAVVDEQLANKADIDRLNREERKEQASLDNLLTTQELNRKKLDTFEADRALDRRMQEAQISNYEASAQASRARGDSLESKLTGGAGGMEDAVDQLLKDSGALTGQYTKPTDDEALPLGQGDLREIARASVKAAAERGVDARTFFSNALRDFYARRTRGVK